MNNNTIMDNNYWHLLEYNKWLMDGSPINNEITILDLRNNNLTELSEKIGNLANLEILFLSNNRLTTLPESIGNMSNLVSLYASNNRLTTLPESIGNLNNLVSFYISSNRLFILPKSIGNLTTLRVFNLSNNNLTVPENIEENFTQIGNINTLTSIDLSNNNINVLPESIGNLVNLKYINLINNNLRTLPESIGNLTKLKYLCLDNYDKWYSFPENINKLTNLGNNVKENINIITKRINKNLNEYKKIHQDYFKHYIFEELIAESMNPKRICKFILNDNYDLDDSNWL